MSATDLHAMDWPLFIQLYAVVAACYLLVVVGYLILRFQQRNKKPGSADH